MRVRFTKLGKVRLTSHRDVARMLGARASGAPSSPSPTPRASRPGPRSASGWPCRPGTSRSPSTSTSTLRRRRRRRRSTSSARRGSPRRCPTASTSRRVAARRRRRAVAAGGRHVAARGGSTVVGADRRDRPSGRRRGAGAPTTLVAHPRAQGPASRSTTSARRIRRPRASPASTTATSRSSPSWPPNPAACARPSCVGALSARPSKTCGCCAPTNGSSATARGGSRSRCRRARAGRAHVMRERAS